MTCAEGNSWANCEWTDPRDPDILHWSNTCCPKSFHARDLFRSYLVILVDFFFFLLPPPPSISLYVPEGWFVLSLSSAKNSIATKSHWNAPPTMWLSTRSLDTSPRTRLTCSVDSPPEDNVSFKLHFGVP